MEPLLEVGLTNAVLATMLGLAAWVIQRLTRWPAFAHNLWLLVLLKLVTPPLILVPVLWPSSWRSEASTPSAGDTGSDLATVSDLQPADNAFQPSAVSNTATSRAPVASLSRGTPSPARAVGRWRSWWKPAVAAIWIGGVILSWSLAAFRIGTMRHLLHDAQPATSNLTLELEILARRTGMSLPLEVWLTPAPIPPMLWAVFGKPRLVIPVALWESLRPEQRQTLLVHELVHLRNGDHWVRRLELVVLGFYWWHPVAWWARRELREAEEQRCDAAVIDHLPDSAVAYAQTLLDTVAYLSRARAGALVGASSMGQVRTLKRRLTMILQGRPSARWSRSCTWLVLGLGAALLPIMPTWAQPQPAADGKSVPKNVPVVKKPDNFGLTSLALQLLGSQQASAQVRSINQDAPDDQVDNRLAELEQKLAALQKEIQALRRLRASRGSQREAQGEFSPIDLQPWGNENLNATAFHSARYEGNNLASLPQGMHTLGGVPFRIGKKLIQLGSRIDKPDKVEDIKIGRRLSKLYILHATGYTTEDGTTIASYTIHYEDGSTATIPVVYGEDVLDWWKYTFLGEPTRGKVVWNGENEPAKREYDATIRLYMTTWENPKPEVRISRIDYASEGDANCVPFCVAMTAR